MPVAKMPLAVCLAVCAGFRAPAASLVNVMVVTDGPKLRRSDPWPPASPIFDPRTGRIDLAGARNETLGFQILPRPAKGISRVEDGSHCRRYRQIVEQVLPAVVTITGQTDDGEIVRRDEHKLLQMHRRPRFQVFRAFNIPPIQLDELVDGSKAAGIRSDSGEEGVSRTAASGHRSRSGWRG